MQLVGMIHLLPLPGAPRYGGSMQAIIDRAVIEAQVLTDAGFDSILIENYGDAPFHKDHVAAETIASMTVVASEVKKNSALPPGIQVLRNDALAALSIAHAVGAEFIRVNVLSGAMLIDQGIIESNAAHVLRYRSHLCPHVKIWADVHVKHAQPMQLQPIEDAALELTERSLADAIIVSGSGTGRQTSPDDVKKVRSSTTLPVVIGSGVTEENIQDYIPFANAMIVGTSIKKDGVITNSIDAGRAKRLVSILKSCR